MANSAFEVFGGDTWFSRVLVTGAVRADLKIIPTDSAPGAGATGRQRRIVICGYHICGHNTNAAATIFTIRNKITTANVLLDGSMIPLTGTIQMSNSNVWLPGTINETIELNVTGALTGQIGITMFGRILSNDFPSTRNYTGAP